MKYIGIDGDRLATIAYKKPLTLWDMDSGTIVRTVDNELGISRIHLALPHAVSLHRKSGTLSIWDLEEGQQVRSLRLDKQVRTEKKGEIVQRLLDNVTLLGMASLI